MFEMIRGKPFSVNGDINCNKVFINNRQVRTIRHFISFQAITNNGVITNNCLVNYQENLNMTYLSTGKYYCFFTNFTPSNRFYSVSISGSWNGLADDNSGMVYSVDYKTTSGFRITQKSILTSQVYFTAHTLANGDDSNTSCTEVSVSY